MKCSAKGEYCDTCNLFITEDIKKCIVTGEDKITRIVVKCLSCQYVDAMAKIERGRIYVRSCQSQDIGEQKK